MDDTCESVYAVEEAQKLTKDIDSALETGGFQVKGWISNKMQGSEAHQQEAFSRGGRVEKVLGVAWDDGTDTSSFKVPADFLQGSELAQLSKRKILSRVAKIYDPIGYAGL
ncbi:uncharacterized protein [Montipora capricornis]|uniref:uncharacterized protein n=1 Tax=Montipora capricornis TaxID=246305 RepID=UPI0035F2022E